MADKFTTYWLINGKKITSFEAMRRKVLAGAIAVEVSAARQREQHERQQLLDKWTATRREMAEKFKAEQQHRQSPEGQRELAVRDAQQHPGGIVSSTGHPAFYELDQYGPDKTNRFK